MESHWVFARAVRCGAAKPFGNGTGGDTESDRSDDDYVPVEVEDDNGGRRRFDENVKVGVGQLFDDFFSNKPVPTTRVQTIL